MTPVTMPANEELLLAFRADTPDQNFVTLGLPQKNSTKNWTSEAEQKILISDLKAYKNPSRVSEL